MKVISKLIVHFGSTPGLGFFLVRTFRSFLAALGITVVYSKTTRFELFLGCTLSAVVNHCGTSPAF